MSSNLVVSLYWYEAPFFVLSIISHGDGFRERRAREWLIPIGIIIFFILSLSSTRTLKSRVPRAFSFVGFSHPQASSTNVIFFYPQRGYVTVYWSRIRVLSSPSEGRPLAAVIINDCWIPWFIVWYFRCCWPELSAALTHSELRIKSRTCSSTRTECRTRTQTRIEFRTRTQIAESSSTVSTLRLELSATFSHSDLRIKFLTRTRNSESSSIVSTLRSKLSAAFSHSS